MSNHPNRSKAKRAGYTTSEFAKGASVRPNPTPEAIVAARGELTQDFAAELIYATRRAWQDWETGHRRMHPAMFELFQIKVQALKMAGSSTK